MRNLAGVDLNLLVTLDALLEERSVTRAAQRLGLSQPAVSNALSRLRDLLGDPVLVRTGAGMTPTPRALELAAPVNQLLRDVQHTLSPPQAFDPMTSTQRFRIGCAAEVELSLLPRLVPRLAHVAPQIELATARVTPHVDEELRTGRMDLYLGTWSKIPAQLRHHLLRQEAFACIARRGHSRVRARLSLRAFAELGHVLVAPGERPDGATDTIHAHDGLGRRIAVRSNDFLTAARIVAASNLIALLPRSAAVALAELLPLSVHRPPLDVSGYPLYMVWHPRSHEQAPHRWLRGVMMDAALDET